MERIEYDYLIETYDKQAVDELLELIVEVLTTKKKYVKIAGDEILAEVVKGRFNKINHDHIEYVFMSLKDNTYAECSYIWDDGKAVEEKNPDKNGNVRDAANINQLLVLANKESYNAILIEEGKSQLERLVVIRDSVIKQFETLESITTKGISLIKHKKE